MIERLRSRFGVERFVELVRYYQAGILNAGFGFVTYAVLVWLGASIYLAQIGSTLLGVSFNYVTYSRHVFRGSGPAKLRFALSYVVNYLVSLAGLAGAELMVRSPYLCGLIAIIFASIVNYFVLKRFVFTSAAGA